LFTEESVPPIRKLAQDVSGKIAAGEVIERPVSVCKELIENSLDADAKRIAVEIAGGGTSVIRISDDGFGIPAEELPLSALNFSTSKISQAEDIERILTLGFRGEALASIRAVSTLTIGSRSAAEEIGREITWRSGEAVSDAPVTRTRGTDVIVEHLFHNLPARKKFLASPASELRRISALVQSYALSFPQVAFTLREDGRNVLRYPASTLEDRVGAVFGIGAFRSLRYFEERLGDRSVRGYVSQPDMTRGNRSLQFFFVNKRSIKDRLLSHAVHQAYHALTPKDRFPLLVLLLDVPPEEIDVNVHPAKAEVRFRNERELHRFVAAAIRGALESSDLSFKEKVQSVYQSIFPGTDDQRSAGGGSELGETAAAAEQLGWVFKETPMSLLEGEYANQIITTGSLYWQLHQSFILIQIRGGMVIVDQHAAHERILFDRAKRNLEGSNPAIQSLLFPATLELTPEEYDRYEELVDVLPSLGFEVEPFGPHAIIVRSIPAGVRNWDDGKLLQQILADEGGDLDALLKRYACRSAVKAGTALSPEEMESLTDQLFATEFPFTCPHGRPTMLRLGTSDLEKRFARTVRPEK
jgi:DNA mismatch repair protein MutL